MLFNSIPYLYFFALVFFGYWLIKNKTWRQVLLLVASLYFYASWRPVYLLLIIFTATVSYFTALAFGKFPSRKKLLLALAIGVNLLILFLFKYWQFFDLSLQAVLSWFNLEWQLIEFRLLLPVGISFYTFQSLGYIIDVYRGQIKPEKNWAMFTLFVTFFPQLVAGPIERSKNLLPQFRQPHRFNYNQAVSGLKLIAFGLFKKVVIADNLALTVNQVYGNLEEFRGLALIIGTVCFAWQIWGDFSGYTDIARGSAKLLGFSLMNNFDTPYLANSITDFWRRWHISLSTWFRDYVYIPLGGNRRGIMKTSFNLFMVFLLCGLWHGASWHFVWWGGFFGVIMVLERLWFKTKLSRLVRLKTPLILKMIYVNLLVLIGWVLFRADNLADVLYIFQNSLVGVKNFISPGYWWATLVQVFDNNLVELGIVVFCLISGLMIEIITYKIGMNKFISKFPLVGRYLLYILVIAIIVLLHQSEIKEFIYFQF